MLNLIEFLLACRIPINLDSYKIHLATGYPNPPLEAFFEGKFKEWQEWQTRRNFPCDMVVSLIDLGASRWLFAGVYKILNCEKMSEKHIAYSTELLDGQDDILGRIIVYHKRKGRASYLWGKPINKEFEICEIREKKLTVEEFPGYYAVLVSFAKLRIIINQNIQSWRGALAKIKGVYLITDTATGKLYVGSATGNDGIWNRWSNYLFNGHGGNKELKVLLHANGTDYKNYFQFSILEIADFHVSDDYIVQRENYWKDVLQTRKFGYNSN